jgi:hypothetical protein
MFAGPHISPENRHIVNRSYGRTRGVVGQTPVGGGKETTVVLPAPGKLGVFKKMPQGIRGSAADKTLRDEFYIWGGLAKGKPVQIPAK